MSQLIEFIESYRKVGNDYQWNDNHGELIRCKDCKYYRGGDCWHEENNDGKIYYQSVINEPNPDDYCSRAERREEWHG